MTAHEWVDASGLPYTATSTDDMCAICSQTPDAHILGPDLIDRQKLLVGLRTLIVVAAQDQPMTYLSGVQAAFAFVEDFDGA